MKSVVFTFSNHPANFFESEKVRKIITNKDKINTMKDLGVDIVINLPFDEFMTKISAIDFVEKILVKKLNAKKYMWVMILPLQEIKKEMRFY